jgi:carbon storage regulator
MLVLSRQRDETIMIGDDIEITIVDIRGDKVRLGITAPREVQVHRKEVYEAIKRENAEASHVQVDDLSVAADRLRSLPAPPRPPGHGKLTGHGKLAGNGNGNGNGNGHSNGNGQGNGNGAAGPRAL